MKIVEIPVRFVVFDNGAKMQVGEFEKLVRGMLYETVTELHAASDVGSGVLLTLKKNCSSAIRVVETTNDASKTTKVYWKLNKEPVIRQFLNKIISMNNGGK